MGYIGFLAYEVVRHFDAIDLPLDGHLRDAESILPECS